MHKLIIKITIIIILHGHLNLSLVHANARALLMRVQSRVTCML